MSTAPAFPDNGNISPLIDALVAADGSSAHPYPIALIAAGSDPSARPLHNLADAVHYLCLLHGRYPGVIDHAAGRSTEAAARRWLVEAAEGFTLERGFMTKLAVALGPVPSTTGQHNCDTTVLQQRHALEMLAQSDRRGCAMGAALALAIDWIAIRRLLDVAALRVGIEPPACKMPSRADSLAVVDSISFDAAVGRAVQFGSRQLLGQHRGLWDLMQSRAEIRAAE